MRALFHSCAVGDSRGRELSVVHNCYFNRITYHPITNCNNYSNAKIVTLYLSLDTHVGRIKICSTLHNCRLSHSVQHFFLLSIVGGLCPALATWSPSRHTAHPWEPHAMLCIIVQRGTSRMKSTLDQNDACISVCVYV